MSQSAEMERLADRVRLAARDGGLIETAQVKLVGLDEVRQAAGARWPRMREHVREGSLKLIASRLGPDDAVVSCGDGFLVVFADAGAEDTQRICADIHDALIAFYLGEDALNALRAEVQSERATAAALANVVARGPAQIARNDLQLGRFWPIWSTRQHMITAHLCAPAIEMAGAPRRMGYDAEYIEKASHRERNHLDLDLCLLEQACAAAEQPHALPVGVTVHATTMQSRKARTIYLQHAAANAAAAHQRMFAMIAEIEPGAPLISLSEWCNGLKQIFPRVGFDMHHSDRALSGIASAGIWAASYHLPHGRFGTNAGLRSALHGLDTWCRALRRQGVLPLVNGFVDTAFLDLASFSDLAFATGEGLWPSRLTPGKSSDATEASAARVG